jgi:MGT family glycosyltransferase
VLSEAEIARATQSGDLTRVPSVVLRATDSLLPFLLEVLARQRPDAVVLDSNALFGHMAVRLLRLPAVSLMTTIMLGPAQYRSLTPREWLRMLAPMLPGLPRVVALRSRLGRRFGSAAWPGGPAFPTRGGLNIVFVPRDFQPENALVDETFRFVGPVIDPQARPDDAPLDTAGPGPLVYVSLGTLHRGSADFFRQCIEAFAEGPARVVLSVGHQTDTRELGRIPASFVVRPSVPQLDVLRQAAVFVTHGGMNSVLEGLYFGVPLVVIPQHVEQLVIGLTVASRGAGLVLREHLAGRRITAAELRRASDRVLAEPGFRGAAAAQQKSLHETGGYPQAADEIQAFIARCQGASASAAIRP